ncbi:alternative ribosome rescue aminoacyl-tRNA hydrolase ArfB [Schaalia hyovaginalis]|uniref:alternative ribosome rescue aminoacyl-tRNA hydrolase ArfB n=1 Tax=Schaalia hyovaginalis TaxID=29316 RepID=UPI0026ECED17|nr:alternative ribosome rescue aminoacyl-tRNA hydrolase ArfB [Schaalia hyovaginalis]MCI6557995.1 aminoacyl-tRNA hydrolase [Schaalia hyovaginalis]MDD7553424.1 alternative ribosome rescue aminoacyl-tRNA hydrolase ArfB [Schaalia hyovaginalis]MDY3094100.1 alternative ribosome rescue aminoacyl-tRNA hydrolase ArfB [Schaalia hyovaginalis]
MDELRIEPGPGIPKGLVVPATELVERFSHSSGPGGQGVNTSDSRVQLAFDVAASSALDDRLRERALNKLAGRLNGTLLVVTASEHRSQFANRKAARERLAALLRAALAPETPRRATRPTRASRLRRLAAKRTRAELKAQRRRPNVD